MGVDKGENYLYVFFINHLLFEYLYHTYLQKYVCVVCCMIIHCHIYSYVLQNSYIIIIRSKSMTFFIWTYFPQTFNEFGMLITAIKGPYILYLCDTVQIQTYVDNNDYLYASNMLSASIYEYTPRMLCCRNTYLRINIFWVQIFFFGVGL